MCNSAPPPSDDHQTPPVARTPAQESARQTQFLNVITRDEAVRRFHEQLTLKPLGAETIPLAVSAGSALSSDVVANVDVPSFDRSNVDGFAVSAGDTSAATEDAPRRLDLTGDVLAPGVRPEIEITSGTASTIATGGMLPRGADAVLMVEHTDALEGGVLEIRRAVVPGENVTFAGTDISRGETVLRTGELLTSRELGVLAAIGQNEVSVYRRPRVAILSTGDEIVPPGEPLPVGHVYDSNAAILSAAVSECGGEPVPMGVIPDDESQLESALTSAMAHDVVLLSGGTSKGTGDLSYRMIERLGEPGIVAHGVALKPGKPICLAVCEGKPVVILPGFPTSAIFTFHEFVAPVVRALAGQPPDARQTVTATVPVRVNSQKGRTEYLLVSLFERDPELRLPNLVAYPMGQGSGSVTTFSRADGFMAIDQHTEIVEAETSVEVTLLDPHVRPADLTVITSHCVGLDRLLSHVRRLGFTLKVMLVGSTGALMAVKRGECDLAGIHLLDAKTGTYNRPFLTDDLELVPGYGRMQSFVFRSHDERFAGHSLDDALHSALTSPQCRMVNRNAGSGTRMLIDRLLSGREADAARPAGYGVQVRSHNAVCAAIEHGRADWGIAIETVAEMYGLESIPVAEEQFDFVIPKSRAVRPAVKEFLRALGDEPMRSELRDIGFRLT